MSTHTGIEIDILPVGSMAANCYLIRHTGRQEIVVIDPGDDGEYLAGKIAASGCSPVGVLLTHGHFDHCMAAVDIQQIFSVPVYLHRNDEFLLRRMAETAAHFLGYPRAVLPPVPTLFSGETPLSVGSFSVTPLATPGHTPGSVSYRCDGIPGLFVGDLVFAEGAVGRTDFSYSSADDLYRSVARVLEFTDAVIYPGHGATTSVRELGAL